MSRLPLLERSVVLTASIGIAVRQGAEEPSIDLLRDADVAMYRAKALGKDRCDVFDPSMHAQAVHRLELELDLRRAIEHDELRVHYQPQVALAGGQIVGLEALVRWQHPLRVWSRRPTSFRWPKRPA